MEILLVQPYEDYQYSYQKLYNEIKDILTQQQVDLVVFPEAFIQLDDEDDAWTSVEYIANLLNKPVLAGLSMPDGSERAYYINWNPKEGDTEDKYFIKHSTATMTIFDYELTNAELESIYAPIILSGQRIQVYICHDMFFPLITERLEQEGINILINLTGGNVKMSKWCNLLKGRSIELNSYVFCTMGNRINMSQPSDRIGYYQGNKLQPCYIKGYGEKEHAFSIFSTVEEPHFLEETSPYYSNKVYDQFTVGTNEQSDCVIDLSFCMITSSLPGNSKEAEHSLHLFKGGENVQVHIANYEELYDRTYLYKQPEHTGAHQIIIYITDREVDPETTIALLKLRAIESRVAAVAVGSNLLIGAKTNRYKDVQLFKGTNHQIGFDLQHMYGIASIYQKTENNMMGIAIKHREKYERLVDL